MTPDDAVKIAEALGTILNGNAVGFFVMVIALVVMGVTLKRLWGMVEARLAECERQHQECRKQNQVLTRALMDVAEGRGYEAKGRLEAAQVLKSG